MKLAARRRMVGRVVTITVLIAATLASAPRRPYSKHDRAFYLDDAIVQFVRPGLALTINSAKIAADGTITAVYTIADPAGLPLDAAGVTTPGTVSLSFVAAVLPGNQQDYMTYTTRTATGTMIASTQQPGADSGGTSTSLGSGQYQYTFKTKAPTGFDATATHTIGIYGSRNLTAFNLGTDYASATYNFVPNGATVTSVHDIIETASCNACHDQLSAHGGSRRGLAMCVLCHTPQNTDPNTGDTLDAKVFFHKLHMGANLPSVKAGTPYIPAKNQFGTFDYSKVVFPADSGVPAAPGDPRRCETCHSQTTGAAQAKAYLLNPTRAACGACHDDVNFATGVNHAGGPQFDDNLCSTCHIPQGEMDFDASIKGAHVPPTSSSLLTGLAVNITNVANGTAGNAPVISFTVQDGSGKGLALSALGFLQFTMAGPTSDYGYTSFGSDTTGTPGYVTESAIKAPCDSSGNCTYTFTHTVPAKATGTYAIGVEARRTEVVLAGTTIQQSIEYGAPNKVVYFSVDGSTVAPRRTVVALANCNQCHVALSVHGTLRNNTEYCVLCHNPSNTDASTRAAATVAADKALPPQGINFNLLIHRIHYGINLQAANRNYTVVGFGGSHNDFSGTLFPALRPTGEATDLRNCAMCHVNSSELNLPEGLNAVVDPQGPINPIQPVGSACTGCHVDIPSAVHVQSNTTALGEACSVCHASGAAYDVDKVHAQY
ncbi:MAG TPA: OmcA/MtrC family decaheme c-type cytochrome [Bryobacteraceae bacterium]|nr:OmcA/MtrC family decaheme c-type cytochrome [Bryobacteraceae bacterium]